MPSSDLLPTQRNHAALHHMRQEGCRATGLVNRFTDLLHPRHSNPAIGATWNERYAR
jgi:hypothetical protein